MADSYTVKGSYATVQVIDPTTVVDVLRISFTTIPSGIYGRANAPYKNVAGFTTANADQAASLFIEPLAYGIERAMGTGRVAGMSAVEDTNASGLLIDYMDVTVVYDASAAGSPLTFEAVVRIPTQAFDGHDAFFQPLVLDPINATYDGLVKLSQE
jgi:hypothetical protein